MLIASSEANKEPWGTMNTRDIKPIQEEETNAVSNSDKTATKIQKGDDKTALTSDVD